MIERDYLGLRVNAVSANAAVDHAVGQDRHPRRRGAPWSLARVCSKGTTTIAVWQALLDMVEARNSLVITPTRELLAAAIGRKRLKTISAALTVLERAKWILRTHVPVQERGHRTATLLRIEVCRMGRPSALYGAHRRKGRSSAPTVEGAKRPKTLSSREGGTPPH